MIIKPFENEYDKEIYDCIKNDPEYNKLVKKKDPVTKEYTMQPEMSEGEKSILYDLVHEVRKFVYFDWKDINIPNFVHNCYKGYTKNKNLVSLQVVANCINYCFPNKLAKLEGGSMYESKKLVITDRPPKIEKEVK